MSRRYDNRYGGYGYGGGSGSRYSIAIYAGLVLLSGIVFIGLTFMFPAVIALIMLFLATTILIAFIKGDLLTYIIMFVFIFPIPLTIGPLHLFPMDIMFAIMMIAVAIKAATKKTVALPPLYYTVTCAVFVILVTISSLRAANIRSTLPEIIQFLYYLLIIPIVTMNLISGVRHASATMKTFVLIMIMQSMLIIVQFYSLMNGDTTITSLFPYANRGGVENYILRSYGSIGPAAGIYLTVAIVALMAESLDASSSIAVKFFGSGGVMLALYATLCTGMRSALGVTAALILGVAVAKKRFVLAVLMALTMLGMSLIVVTVGKDVYPFKLFYGHAGHRSDDIDKALNVFEENILLGVGPMQFKRDRAWGEVTGVENEFVRRLVEGGIFNALLYIIWIIVTIYIAALAAQSPDKETAALAIIALFSFTVFVLNGFFASDLFDGGHGHLMMFIVGITMSLRLSASGKRPLDRAYY